MRMQTKSYAPLLSFSAEIYRDFTLQLGNVGQQLTRAEPAPAAWRCSPQGQYRASWFGY
jgi:hypothetical protein